MSTPQMYAARPTNVRLNATRLAMECSHAARTLDSAINEQHPRHYRSFVLGNAAGKARQAADGARDAAAYVALLLLEPGLAAEDRAYIRKVAKAAREYSYDAAVYADCVALLADGAKVPNGDVPRYCQEAINPVAHAAKAANAASAVLADVLEIINANKQ